MRYALDRTIFYLLRQFDWVWPQYRVRGCRTYDHRSLVEGKIPFGLSRPLQEHYNEVRGTIRDRISRRQKYSIIRLGDGEALFLQGWRGGNIGRRHLTDDVAIDLSAWRRSYQENDLLTFDSRWGQRRLWNSIEGERIRADYTPLTAIYALVANRDIFQLVKSRRVGIIGPGPKLAIIERLLRYPQYREYLGLAGFDSYVEIPQRGAVNDAEKVLRDIVAREREYPCDVYLVGLGIAKLRILSGIRDALDAVVIDIGSGLDAIAGIIPKDRPYFGSWVNYKLVGYDYDHVDVLAYHIDTAMLDRFTLADDVILD